MHAHSVAILRVIHLVSFALFVGSIFTVYVFKFLAERSSEINYVADILRLLVKTDKFVTGPSAMLLALTGLALLTPYGVVAISMLWIQLLIALWTLGLVLAHLLSIPKLKALSALAAHSAFRDEAYVRLSNSWNRINHFLIALILTATIVAIYKPLL